MNRDEALKRITILRDELERHNYLYYVVSNPAIADYEYDMLMKELMNWYFLISQLLLRSGNLWLLWLKELLPKLISLLQWEEESIPPMMLH